MNSKDANGTQKGDPGASYADADGQFRRKESTFRSIIPSDRFPAVAGRYVLYVHPVCPWAHRTSIVRQLKGLEDIIQLVILDDMDRSPGKGWYFSGKPGFEKDPLYGAKYLRELYEKAEPGFEGRVTVPMLWDKENQTIVNNESSEIIRFLYTAFDDLLPAELKESSKGEAALYPQHLSKEIDEMNTWIYHLVNNGVYKTGFASTQEAYEEHIYPLFEGLDRLEKHLGSEAARGGPYLFGKNITEADIRLYATIVRFDVAYYLMFKCNLKMIRHDYPRLHDWLRTLYWGGEDVTARAAFRETTKFDFIKKGYSLATVNKIVPAGPDPAIMPL